MKRFYFLVLMLGALQCTRAQQQIVHFGFDAMLDTYYDSAQSKTDTFLYDNFNSFDASAKVRIMVLVENNDSLHDTVGADLNPIDGTAKLGVHYNFSQQKIRFYPGTNVFDGSYRKDYPITLVGDSIFYGHRYFFMKLNNQVGVLDPDGFISRTTLLKVIIDYDGHAGTPKLSFEQYSLFPVPAHERLYINGVQGKTYVLIDITGRIVAEGNCSANSIETAELTPGLYVLQAVTDKGLIQQRFTKE